MGSHVAAGWRVGKDPQVRAKESCSHQRDHGDADGKWGAAHHALILMRIVG
jgi:hypothetical protein